MKKTLYSIVILSMLMWTVSPAVLAETVGTGLIRGEGGGEAPIIKAKWEMKGPSFNGPDYVGYGGGEGVDDSTAAGAQFTPPGVWDDEMHYTVCAIVTDPNGAADIDGVYADIYYPEGIAFHPESPEPWADVVGGGTTSTPDYGDSGCGDFIEENTLIKLDKMEGWDLFCDHIKNGNNNLPTIYSPYDYDEICAETGELMKEEAYVYCDDKTLTWEDPAGDYRVELFALDQAGNFSYDDVPNINHFEYLPMIGFEVDFDRVEYGQVMLNTHKIISGDLTWDGVGNGDSPASVRNIGNTRLYMWVEQDDMGLGQTSGEWNVEYDARIGNEELDWAIYDPEVNTRLEDILDLSEMEEMDFSILITKFPAIDPEYYGDMVLSATQANFRECCGC
ncbi:hypothetical protein HOD96_02010 [Candidatus Falkowbacteria bacterium]|jgi:hypothetical protein|nr:hypothetical protein [Candidatus Falkowbacteria bacterium]MBT4433064.1 hypothetical protein [Candidatus Falkowbacteria bacterium]